jgi:HlyD family secretion protein
MSEEPNESVRDVPVHEIIPGGVPIGGERRLPAAAPLPQRRGKRIPLAIGLSLALLLLAALIWYGPFSGSAPVRYQTALVDRGPITAVVTATGTVNPVVSVQVGSQVSGKIAQLSADFNSVVTKGQVLAQIDQQPFKARVSQARAAVKSARGNLAKAKNMARQRKLERDRMAALRPQA